MERAVVKGGHRQGFYLDVRDVAGQKVINPVGAKISSRSPRVPGTAPAERCLKARARMCCKIAIFRLEGRSLESNEHLTPC